MNRATGWFKGLSKGARVAVVASVAFYTLIGMGIVGAATGSQTPPPKQVATPVSKPETHKPAEPKVETKNVEEKSVVSFSATTKDDAARAAGTSAVVQEGVDGERTLTYEVTYIDGKEQSRKQVGDVVTKQPIPKIIANGTYVAPPPPPVEENPSGATAKCRDGSLSYSANRRGTCSHHGGVAVWY